jgi:hypothetical protein
MEFHAFDRVARIDVRRRLGILVTGDKQAAREKQAAQPGDFHAIAQSNPESKN